MYYVYLIKSINFPDQTYVGYTADLKERLKVHNSGRSPHTAKYKPWDLQTCRKATFGGLVVIMSRKYIPCSTFYKKSIKVFK